MEIQMNGTIEKDKIPSLTAGANADAPTLTEAAIAKKPETIERGKRDHEVITSSKIKKVTKKVAKEIAKKVAKKVAKKAAKKAEPTLPAAAVDRLRNGTSSIPIETKTLGLTYSVIQRALKRELGAAGYTALIKANRAAKARTGVAKPAAKKSRAKPAKAAGKKRGRKVKAAQ
jgi:hypothetical protein